MRLIYVNKLKFNGVQASKLNRIAVHMDHLTLEKLPVAAALSSCVGGFNAFHSAPAAQSHANPNNPNGAGGDFVDRPEPISPLIFRRQPRLFISMCLTPCALLGVSHSLPPYPRTSAHQ